MLVSKRNLTIQSDLGIMFEGYFKVKQIYNRTYIFFCSTFNKKRSIIFLFSVVKWMLVKIWSVLFPEFSSFKQWVLMVRCISHQKYAMEICLVNCMFNLILIYTTRMFIRGLTCNQQLTSNVWQFEQVPTIIWLQLTIGHELSHEWTTRLWVFLPLL